MADMKWLVSRNEFQSYIQRSETLRLYKLRLVDLLTRNWRRSKHLPGYSVTVGHMVDFTIDPKLTLPSGGYNLRETVNCPETGFNMRMRAAIHAIIVFEQSDTGPVYICEQKTPMYRYFKNYFDDLVGSEYLGSGVPLGQRNVDGLRNEDATRLTFADNSFNVLMSFEVLEHIPDFASALREAHRVLQSGGRFYFTAPFNPHVESHLIRARIAGLFSSFIYKPICRCG